MVAKHSPAYELLIADDDPDFRDTLKGVFEPHFRLVEATCGEEAIEIIQRRPVDLALFDMHMHVLTGLETVRIVRSLRATIPCIIITADASEELRRDAEEIHVFTVLPKPVRKAALVRCVSLALQSAYDDPELSGWLEAEFGFDG